MLYTICSVQNYMHSITGQRPEAQVVEVVTKTTTEYSCNVDFESLYANSH